MDRLRSLYESLGYSDVRTFLQSGNVIFSATGEDREIVRNLEEALSKKFGFEIPVVMRTMAQLNRIVRNNPLLKKEAIFLHVTFLRERPKPFFVQEIEKGKIGSEEFLISKEEVYLYCPHGYGRTKLNNSFFERKLGVLATTRNWRTVTSLLAA